MLRSLDFRKAKLHEIAIKIAIFKIFKRTWQGITAMCALAQGALPQGESPLVLWRLEGMMPSGRRDTAGRSKVIHPFPQTMCNSLWFVVVVPTIGKPFFHMGSLQDGEGPQEPGKRRDNPHLHIFEHTHITTYGFERTPHQRSDAKFRSLFASDMAKFFWQADECTCFTEGWQIVTGIWKRFKRSSSQGARIMDSLTIYQICVWACRQVDKQTPHTPLRICSCHCIGAKRINMKKHHSKMGYLRLSIISKRTTLNQHCAHVAAAELSGSGCRAGDFYLFASVFPCKQVTNFSARNGLSKFFTIQSKSPVTAAVFAHHGPCLNYNLLSPG